EIWRCGWLMDHQYKPKNGDADNGLVLDGEAVTAARIATDLGVSPHTAQVNLRRLETERYIRSETLAGKGKQYYITKPKRWQLATLAGSVQTSSGKLPDPLAKNVQGNKEQDFQDSKKQHSRPSAFDPLSLNLPTWLSRNSWSELVEHRRQIKKPFTDLAARKTIEKL